MHRDRFLIPCEYNPGMNSLLIYNPAAGRIAVRPFVYRAARVLRAAGWSVRIATTRSSAHVTELAQQAAADGVEAVFAVGGDGTMGRVAAGLAGSSTALGILPAGTANVLAQELGLSSFDWYRPGALEENAAELVRASVHSVDMGLCNGKPFLLWAGMGLDGLTIRRMEPRQRLSKYVSVPHFFVEAVSQASGWSGAEVQVRAEGFSWGGRIVQMVATNIRRYMGGLAELSPNACLDDGLLDLWMLSGSNLVDSLRHAFGMVYGLHLTATDAYHLGGRKMVIEADHPLAVQLDGEAGEEATRLEIESYPGALRLLLPEKARKLLKSV